MLHKRIVCLGCNNVSTLETDGGEEFIHGLICPQCGEQTLHELPIFGTWPREYEVLASDVDYIVIVQRQAHGS